MLREHTVPVYLSIVGLGLSIAAAVAEDLPPAIQTAITENARGCKTFAIEKSFVTRKDINGDGRPDFVLDYGSFNCDGDRRAFCGSLGCLNQVFVSLPSGAYTKVVELNVRTIAFRAVRGVPAIVLGLAGDANPCRKGPGDICEVTEYWTGATFAPMPVSRPPRQAAAAAPSLAGPAAPRPGDWLVSSSGSGVTASRAGFDPEISVTCNAQTHSVGLVITFNKYKGRILQTIEDKESPFILDVQNGRGGSLKFPMVAYYSSADGGDNWISKESVSSAFLDAFAQEDGRLIWQTATGVEIVSWPLHDTAKARGLMRQVCNF